MSEEDPRVLSLSRLRRITKYEGMSFLVLLFVAMPLKYFFDQPMAVRVVGSLHGLLFVLFCLALLHTFRTCRWPLSRAALVFAAGFLPFGPFLVDPRLAREEAGIGGRTGAAD